MQVKTLKVIEYISTLGDGGAETLVKDYVRLLDKERFQCAVVVLRNYEHTANTRTLRELGTSIFPIYPRWNFLVRVWNKLFGRRYVPYRLKKILKEENADVLHVHLDNLKNVQAIGSTLRDVRLFYTCHNLPELCVGKAEPKENAAAKELIKKNALRLIALHDDMKNELNEMFGVDTTVVMRNGVDFKRFKAASVTKEEERARLGVPNNAFVLGHVGRFSEQKNHPFLVEVFREVAARDPDAFLLMVGAGETEDIEKKLDMYGLKGRYMILSHRQDVHEIMRAFDVFVFPSVYEGLGIVLIEAQVTGLRCVISDTITTEAIKSYDVVSLPLQEPSRWAEVILDENVKGNICGNLDDYDMNREIKRLEKLYAGEWDE